MHKSSALMMFTFILLHSMSIMKFNNIGTKQHMGFFDDHIYKRTSSL